MRCRYYAALTPLVRLLVPWLAAATRVALGAAGCKAGLSLRHTDERTAAVAAAAVAAAEQATYYYIHPIHLAAALHPEQSLLDIPTLPAADF